MAGEAQGDGVPGGGLMADEAAAAGLTERVTPDSVLVHEPRATLSQLTAALLSRAHGSYSDDDVRFIARLYFGACVPIGIDPLLAVAQMRLETGNLDSPWSQPPHYNPAGIGVTSKDSAAGVSFPNWPYAVRAHVGRLAAYAVPTGSETDLQRLAIREALHWRDLPERVRGAAPTLRGLVGTWATDTAYADKLSGVANDIAGEPTGGTGDGSTTGGTGSQPRIITARSLGLAFKNLFGELGPELNVTGHYSGTARAHTAEAGVAAARSFHIDHMHKGWGGIGYHYVIPDDGTLICCRPTILKGAHVYRHNSNNIGVNMPGTTGDRPTDAQAATFRWLLAHAHTDALPKAHRCDRDLRQAKRWGHRQWADNATACPGSFLAMYLAGGDPGHGDFVPGDPEPDPAAIVRSAPLWHGNILVDFERVAPEEAAAARDPATVEDWLPPADARFDREIANVPA